MQQANYDCCWYESELFLFEFGESFLLSFIFCVCVCVCVDYLNNILCRTFSMQIMQMNCWVGIRRSKMEICTGFMWSQFKNNVYEDWGWKIKQFRSYKGNCRVNLWCVLMIAWIVPMKMKMKMFKCWTECVKAIETRILWTLLCNTRSENNKKKTTTHFLARYPTYRRRVYSGENKNYLKKNLHYVDIHTMFLCSRLLWAFVQCSTIS